MIKIYEKKEKINEMNAKLLWVNLFNVNLVSVLRWT